MSLQYGETEGQTSIPTIEVISCPPLHETSVAFFSSCKGKKVEVTLEQAMMVQRESRVIALLLI